MGMALANNTVCHKCLPSNAVLATEGLPGSIFIHYQFCQMTGSKCFHYKGEWANE